MYEKKSTNARKIPNWLWMIITKALGIKTHPDEKPIIATLLYITTFGSASVLFLSNAFYRVFAVLSKQASSNILDATVSIMVMSFFCGLVVYSHDLAYRLFMLPQFTDMLRLHSKRFMRINSAILIIFLLTSFVVVLNVSTVDFFDANIHNSSFIDPTKPLTNNATVSNLSPCSLINIRVEICQIYWVSQMTSSVFFLLWNLLVAVMLVSVARTQTVNIRRFLKELEHDASLLDNQLQAGYNVNRQSNLDDYVWMSNSHIGDIFNDEEDKVVEENRFNNNEDLGDESSTAVQVEDHNTEEEENNHNHRFKYKRLSSVVIDNVEVIFTPHIMSQQEIMHKYWKIAMNCRLTSLALQRWVSSLVGMILAWSAIRMVYWLSHDPNGYGVFMFVVPLLLLPLLASSYAEVNFVGGKVIQSILPTENRVDMFRYLYGQPIQMSVYGHVVSYRTIGTVVVGILAAFTSKIFIQEINKL